MPITTASCWNCGRQNPTHALAGVRFALCKCKALFPSETLGAFLKSGREVGLPYRERLILADA